MEETVTKISETAGLAPGTLIPVGIDQSSPSKFVLSVIGDGVTRIETVGSLIGDIPTAEAGQTLWIDVQGYAGLTSIKHLLGSLNIHPLFQEDILNTRQRVKYEVLDKTMLLNARRLVYGANNRIHSEPVVFLLQGNTLITFQPGTRDSFEGVRRRLPLFSGGKTVPGYVLYALVDNLVDNYFAVLERLQETIEKTEKQLVADAVVMERGELSGVKHDIISARHVIWPMKNALTKLSDDKADVFPVGIDPYLSDLRDHVQQLDEACEVCSEGVNGIIQLNMDNLNNKTNEIMKTLALISTVFLPLTFIAGVYGMNFDFMPELRAQWGYPFVLGVMAIIALILYKTFKTRHWM